MFEVRGGKGPRPHMDNAEVAQGAVAGMLVLTHLQPDLERPSVQERMVVEMAHIYQGPIIVGEDLMDVPMRPPGHDNRRLMTAHRPTVTEDRSDVRMPPT